MRVAYSGTARGLIVTLDGHTLIAGLTLNDFSPALTWRFGFGARTGNNPEQIVRSAARGDRKAFAD